jgi:hypothetical protein
MTRTRRAAIDLPVVILEEIFHVGSFQGYAPRFGSQEANALSASTCPDAWRTIARIGGAPTWRLTKPGARFLDALALTPAEQLALDAHAVALGLAARAPEWRLWSNDCETDERVYMLFPRETDIRRRTYCVVIRARKILIPSVPISPGRLHIAWRVRRSWRRPTQSTAPIFCPRR